MKSLVACFLIFGLFTQAKAQEDGSRFVAYKIYVDKHNSHPDLKKVMWDSASLPVTVDLKNKLVSTFGKEHGEFRLLDKIDSTKEEKMDLSLWKAIDKSGMDCLIVYTRFSFPPFVSMADLSVVYDDYTVHLEMDDNAKRLTSGN